MGRGEALVELLRRSLPLLVGAEVGTARVAVGHLRVEEGVHLGAEFAGVEGVRQAHPGAHVVLLFWGQMGEGVDVDVIFHLNSHGVSPAAMVVVVTRRPVGIRSHLAPLGQVPGWM